MPSEARVELVLAEIRKGSANYDYFFDSLSSPEWIKPLAAKNVFHDPPEPERSEDWIRIPGWSASRYLARMAQATPSDVLEVALAVKTDNERIHSDLTEAAAAMPGPLAARWAEHEVIWLRDRGLLHVLLDDKLATLIVRLTTSGEVDAAFSLADELLRIYRPPEDSEETHRWMNRKASARVSTWQYHRILDTVRPALVSADAQRALALLAERLDQSLDWAADAEQSRTDYEDFSSIWRARISDEDRADNEVEQALVSAVRDAASQALDDRLLSPAEVVETLSPYRWTVIRRIRLHALVQVRDLDAELMAEQLLDRQEFGAATPSHEYRVLLELGFSRLSGEAQQQILGWIDEGPDLDEFRAVRESVDGRAPGDEEVAEHALRWKIRRLALLGSHLPDEWKARHEQWLKEIGPHVFSADSGVRTWVGPTSPFSVEELSAMSDIRLLEEVVAWAPPGGWDSPTPEGLGHALGELAQREPLRMSRLAKNLRGQIPPYVQWTLSGLSQALRAGQRVEWSPLLALIDWVAVQPRELPGGRDDEYGEFDPGWVWTRKEIASLLSAGFESSGAPIPINERARVWNLIAVLVEDGDPTPEHEERYGGANMDPSTLSLNTTRGQAMHAAIRYGLWVRRSMEVEEGEAALREEGLKRMPELREALMTHLQPSHDPSLAVRSVYGQWFPWLLLLDPAWARKHAAAIFEFDDVDRWAAAWGAYIIFNRPYDDVFSAIEEQYRQAVQAVGSPHPTFRWLGSSGTPQQRLAEHLMVFYWRGRDNLHGGGPLGSFYRQSDDQLRGHAMEFLGRTLRETVSIDAEALARLQALWEGRFAARRAGAESAKELGAFGWWFSAEILDADWRLAQAQAVLDLNLRLEPNFAVFETLALLASRRPGPTARVLRAMLERERDDWSIDAHRNDIGTALAGILASQDREARELAANTAHWLGSQGYRNFRPLVADQPRANTRDG